MSDSTWLSVCQQGACVEARLGDAGDVLVRHSKLADASPVLRFTASQWANLLADIRAHRAPRFAVTTDDLVRLRCEGEQIVFSVEEWAAFVAGVQAGTFNRLTEEITDGSTR